MPAPIRVLFLNNRPVTPLQSAIDREAGAFVEGLLPPDTGRSPLFFVVIP
jgi:hypothetical protein